MIRIVEMYLTLLPAMLAGVFNMLWCTLPWGKCLKKPIDGGRKLKDGQRVFGDNKTWKGLLGMVVLGVLFTIIWGFLSRDGFLAEHNLLYRYYPNTIGYNSLLGLAFGLAYSLFELPNSFLKRRLGILPGKPKKGASAAVFVFLDQADSVIGLVLVVALVYPMEPWFFVAYVLLGAVTHIVLNLLLYALKLRKNPF